jgi:hypothetical protein
MPQSDEKKEIKLLYQYTDMGKRGKRQNKASKPKEQAQNPYSLEKTGARGGTSSRWITSPYTLIPRP